MQEAEARIAVRTAELAAQVAQEAQVAAEKALADLEAANRQQNEWEKKSARKTQVEPFPNPAAIQKKAEKVLTELDAANRPPVDRQPREAPPEPFLKPVPKPMAKAVPPPPPPAQVTVVRRSDTSDKPEMGILWEPDMPALSSAPAEIHESLGEAEGKAPEKNWQQPAVPQEEHFAGQAFEPVEPAQPIFANLIEFPRELVAPRKARPRLAEAPNAADCPTELQLSIFDVETETISVEPPPAEETEQAVGPEWSGLQLETPSPAAAKEDTSKDPGLELASLNRRLVSAVIDGCLIAGVFLAVAVETLSHMTVLPTLRNAEIGAVIGLFVTAVLYLLVFSLLTASTPGMKYAGISLCTFDDEFPTCTQRCQRLGALFLSLAPMGLGLLWGLFDEENLSWHDRFSGTYQRKC
jgi:uncharacterized RDD family membrane protein YckC